MPLTALLRQWELQVRKRKHSLRKDNLGNVQIKSQAISTEVDWTMRDRSKELERLIIRDLNKIKRLEWDEQEGKIQRKLMVNYGKEKKVKKGGQRR